LLSDWRLRQCERVAAKQRGNHSLPLAGFSPTLKTCGSAIYRAMNRAPTTCQCTLYLHVHDVVVSRRHLVAHLNRGLQGKVGFCIAAMVSLKLTLVSLKLTLSSPSTNTCCMASASRRVRFTGLQHAGGRLRYSGAGHTLRCPLLHHAFQQVLETMGRILQQLNGY